MPHVIFAVRLHKANYPSKILRHCQVRSRDQDNEMATNSSCPIHINVQNLRHP